MGLSRRSSKALCFLIDTTDSMKDDIAEVNSAASAVIDSAVGTENEPSVYMLVAFNDPGRSPDYGTWVRAGRATLKLCFSVVRCRAHHQEHGPKSLQNYSEFIVNVGRRR